MTASREFNKKFTIEYLKSFYFNNVKFKCTTGIDRINRRIFEKEFSKFIEVISRKVLNGTYRFTPYKEKLIVKGRHKNPRLISIPTIRDKIALGVLKEIIVYSFRQDICHKQAQTIIGEVKRIILDSKCEYDYFIKIDIEDFYGTLNHDLLIRRVKTRIRKKEIVNLIEKAIKTPTVSEKSLNVNKSINTRGVPQGLPISNILSSVYLIDIDRKHFKSRNYKYFRYVDDILILCRKEDFEQIKSQIYDDIETSHLLRVNSDKELHGEVEGGFAYLGYFIKNSLISVKKEAVRKQETSLEKMFVEFSHSKYSNPKFFVWKLNLKITGCLFNDKRYGWVFFYSRINDIRLLFHLDWMVQKLIQRFKVGDLINGERIKRYVRAYQEITKNLQNSNYINRFDESYSQKDKINFLEEVADIRTASLTDDQIDIEFNKILFSSIRDLEQDTQEIS